MRFLISSTMAISVVGAGLRPMKNLVPFELLSGGLCLLLVAWDSVRTATHLMVSCTVKGLCPLIQDKRPSMAPRCSFSRQTGWPRSLVNPEHSSSRVACYFVETHGCLTATITKETFGPTKDHSGCISGTFIPFLAANFCATAFVALSRWSSRWSQTCDVASQGDRPRTSAQTKNEQEKQIPNSENFGQERLSNPLLLFGRENSKENQRNSYRFVCQADSFG